MVFGLSLSGSKSKSKTTSSSTSSSTSMPVLPGWAGPLADRTASLAGGVADLDPASLVAPAHPLMNQAASGAASLTGMGSLYRQAAGLVGDAAHGVPNGYRAASGAAGGYEADTFGGATLKAPAASMLENLSAYMSPYRRDVVDSALADFDFGAGQTRAQQDLDLAGAGAFGGSGAALTKSMTEDALVRGRAATSSKLLDDSFRFGAEMSDRDANRRQQVALSQAGFQQDAGLASMAARNQASQFNAGAQNDMTRFNVDARNQASAYNAGARDRAWDRRLNAGQSLANIAGAYESGQRANLQTQLQVGESLRGVDQQARMAPVTHAQQLVGLLSGLPIGLFSGQQTNSTEQGLSKTKGSQIGVTAEAKWG